MSAQLNVRIPSETHTAAKAAAQAASMTLQDWVSTALLAEARRQSADTGLTTQIPPRPKASPFRRTHPIVPTPGLPRGDYTPPADVLDEMELDNGQEHE